MKTYAKIRDWKRNEFIPTSKGFIQFNKDEWILCNQPDELDNHEFNLIPSLKNDEILARLIDFNFK